MIRGRKRTPERGLLAAAVALAFASFAAHGDYAPTDPPERTTVRLQLKWLHQFQFAGYYAAIKNGYYAEAGLDVILLEAEEDREPARVVLDGDAEFGIATSDLVLLWGQGEPILVLAPVYQHSPLIYLTDRNSGIDSVHRLAGKRVMLEDHAAELIAYLNFEGVDKSQIDIVPHVFDPGPLIRGEVDAISAYSTDEPFLLREAGIEYFTLSPRTAGIDFYGDTLFTTQDFARENPDLVARFLEASMRGWSYALENIDEMAGHVFEAYSERHSVEHLLFEGHETRALILPDVVEIGYNNPGRWRHIAEVYAALGLVTPGLSLDGFLYNPERPRQTIPDWVVLYLSLSLAIITVMTVVGVRFHKLNERIHRQAQSLGKALEEIKVLRGIIPICAHCKKIRDDEGSWNQMEKYISEHSEASFSHGICEDCARQVYGEYIEGLQEKDRTEPLP